MLNPIRSALVTYATVAAAVATMTAPVYAQDPVEVAIGRRVADVVDIAVAEYTEGVVDGRVVQLEELNEARLFIESARRAAEQLNPGLANDVIPLLGEIADLIDALAPDDDLRQRLAAVREIDH